MAGLPLDTASAGHHSSYGSGATSDDRMQIDDIESGQLDRSNTASHTGESLPPNIAIVEDEGRPPFRSLSKEAELARREAAENAAALKRLPDADNPLHWSDAKKIKNNSVLALATFSLTYSSSFLTPSLAGLTQHYGVSSEATIVGLSLFVLGFGVGPFLSGPTSDVVGRRLVYIVSYACFTAFSWGVAYAPNYGAFIVFRFLAGLSGASSLNNHPASISDFTSPRFRNRYSAAYALCAFGGASIGPLTGGFITVRASWHWNLIVTAILVTISWLLIIVGTDESCAPVLLARKNKSRGTHQAVSFGSRYRVALILPWKLLFTEPILALLCFYIAFLYAVFYAIFPVAPIIYVEVRGWSEESLALSYIAPTLGFIVGALILRFGQDAVYDRLAKRNPGVKPPPDSRFATMLWFSWTVPVGIFLLAFCSYRHVHWFGDVFGMFLFAMGILIVFTGLIPFTIDLYLAEAASALAAQVATRAIAASAFPLFSRQMYHAMGIPGASSLLAGIAVLLTIMPFALKRYGRRLWSHRA